MMKKTFIKFSMLLILLGMSVNAAWGQISLGDIDLQNPATWFYVNLEAKVSTPACGSNPGQVKLNYTNTRREQDNPWITDAKPVNPYLSDYEKYSDFNEKWGNGSERGRQEAETQDEKSNYPAEEEGVEGWSAEQVEVAKQGYDAGWDWQKRTNGNWQQESFPSNPYYDSYSRYESLKNEWNDGFNAGEDDAKAGLDSLPYCYYYVTCPHSDNHEYTSGGSDLGADRTGAIKGYGDGWHWYKAGRWLNSFTGEEKNNYATAWGASANLNGYALFRMEGVDSVLNGMISSYAYFEAKVKENDGWYFTGWSFTEGESDLGGAVDTDTEEDKGKLFKIFPAEDPGWANKSQEYVYATFKPVMVANYTVNGTIDLTPGNGNSGNNTVIFDVQGDRVSADDFTASVASADTEGYTGHGSCVASAALVNGQIVVTVTYTASDAVSGIYRANVTLRSKSGCSELTVPMYVRVSAAAGSQASLYNGKAEPANFVKAGTLAAMISEATAEQTVALNADYTDVVNINKDVTFDLNGYTLSNNLVVSGGNVTLAYSKYKGKITKTVAVQSGATLTLNGGTIEVSGAGNPLDPAGAVVAVNVVNGGKLIQNGATISATASTCYAIGINVDGEAEVKDGSITAHAGMTAAFAAQVSATGKLTTTGGAFNASVDQTHKPTAKPTDQSTWSNAYAVYVSETSGEATIKGGTFYSTSSYDGAFAVCALATFGKLTIEKGAIVAAHTVRNLPVAYAVGSMGSANLTVNGGRFSATYVEDEQVKPCPPFLCAGFANLDFKAGYIKADSVYVRDDMFEQTASLVQPKLYNITYKGKDYMDGYRYLAVREGLDAKEYGMQAARIGTTGYTSIADALDYANNNRDKDVVIFLQNDDVLPAGYYTIPKRTTLIIPMKNEQETGNPIIPRIASTSGSPVAYVQPYAYVTLTVAPGANIDVHGLIEVSGTQRATDGSYAAHPHGPCGFVIMQEGSNMTMQSGSELRAWGFIIGKGETDVRRDATVREQFQMGDWKGGSTSFGMLSDSRRVFPLTHYYIQNIESPFKYHPGAVLSTTTAVSATFGGIAVTASANDIKVVGVNGRDDAMFLMDNEADADNTWVRKWYDVENDLQVYDVNNSAHIGSMVLDLGKLGNTPLQMNSGYFVLPITCNFKIHLLSGMMDFTQNTALLPGAEVEVDKEAVVTVVKNNDESVLSGSLYIYDADQWDKYAYDESANGGIKYTKPVQYAAGFGGKPTARAEQFYDKSKLKDASINVHGSFAINEDDCFLYTSEGGANIFSSNEDAGTFVFNVAGPTMSDQAQVWQVMNRSDYNDGDAFTAAQLKNKEGHEPAFTGTTGYGANASICYMDDEWRYRAYFDCYAADADMDVYLEEALKRVIAIKYPDAAAAMGGYDLSKSVSHIYIKPQEWVEIASRAIIDFDLPEDEDERNTLSDLALAYVGALQSGNEEAINEAYDDLYPVFYPYAMTFRLVEITGNADHTCSDVAGAGRLFILMDNCQWWEVEKKDNLYHCIHPNNDTYYYWQEEVQDPYDQEVMIPAHWEEKRFTITWKNWDDTPLETIGPDETPVTEYSVTYGTMAEFLGTNPTREETIDYTYDFTGWTPALGPVTSDVTYTATYTQKPRKYTIIFCQEGGVEIERQFLTHNEVPVCENVPTKVGHTLVWSPAIAAVTGDATYTATWHENPPTKYEVTFFDYDGKTPLQRDSVAVGAMPEYTGATPTGKATWAEEQDNKEFTYVFDHWSPEIEKVTATSIKSYTAVYAESPLEYTITFKNEDNSVRETQKYHYGETPVCSNLPTKAATAQYTYTLRWDPQIQTVMEDATYKAVFDATTNKYTVTLKSDPASACTFTGAGTFNYGTTVNNVAVSYDSEAYEFLGWADLTGAAKTATTHSTFTLTGDITIVANFRYKGDDKVTITWNNWDGSVLGTSESKVNAATTYTGATPTKPAEAAYTYTFDGWTDAQGNFYKNNQTPKATADATYIAHFTAVPVPNLTISNNNGAPTVLSEPVQYHDLVITSNGATYSGQLVGSNYLSLTGNAYFDLAINAKTHTWYAIAVPWQVNPTNGISVNGRTLVFGSDFDILYYDGAERAAGNAAWKYLELKEGDKTIQPGTLYMIGLMMDAPVIRFAKKEGAPLLTNTTSVSAYDSSTGSDTDANWNGIANPALFAAYVNAGATLGQVYNASTGGYDAINLGTTKLILGQPVFVQAPADKNITVSYGSAYAAAPHRAKAAETSEYELRISTYGAKYTDRLFVQADEAKEHDVYTIGKDLAKMGVSARVAQMWINRYDTKLCMNTFAPINGVAEYPLGIYTPKNGEYRLSLATMPDSETSIYLTYDGEAIWNLANGAYAVDLEKGTDNHYGIRVTVKNAPQTTTGIDEAIVDAKGETHKVLINDQVFIIRGDKVYSIDGQLVK